MKRIISLLLVSTLIFSMSGCKKNDEPTQQAAFDEFIEEEFIESIKQDFLSTHVFMIHPEQFGIDPLQIEVNLGPGPTEEYFNECHEEYQTTVEKFNQFNRKNLTASQQETYDIYQYMLDLNKESINEKYNYMGNYFSSISGIHSQLPTLFSDYQFYEKQDIDDLITLIKDTKRYIDEILTYTKKQDELGYFMSNNNADSVIEYCNKILEAGSDSAIIMNICHNIDAFEEISAEEKEQYKIQAKEAFQDYFLTAYQNIVDTVSSLKSDDDNSLGLVNVTNGKEYYELLYKNATGSQYSIKQMKEKLLNDIEDNIQAAQKVVYTNPDAYDLYVNDDIKTNYTDYQSMLQDLNEWYKRDFPDIGELSYEIQSLDPEVASSGVAAYYNLPPLDNNRPNQIRVNTNDGALDIQSLDTFETVAHEGIPGHMYQVNYAYQNLDNNFRKISVNFSGYTEGYATYIQSIASKYLDINQDAVEIYTHLNHMINDVVAYLDIAIHYDGWDKNQVSAFLDDNGLNSDATEDIFNQLQENPTAFLSYYIGCLEIIEMKEDAQEKLGDKFSELGFHEALLKSGQAPFSIVRKNIDDYIRAAK